jgi:hypothetical protein
MFGHELIHRSIKAIFSLALAASVLLAGSAAPQPAAVEAKAGSGDRIWIGPNPFIEQWSAGQAGRAFRPDWLPNLRDATKWPVVLANANVLKTYIMVLPPDHKATDTAARINDVGLQELVQLTRQHGLKMAFEVGGLRTSAKVCGESAGEDGATRELALLGRWTRAGGQIDYLTTDHAVMKNMRGVGYRGSGLDPARGCKMTVHQLIAELVDYFQVVHKEMPLTKLGVIESLGFFEVKADDKTYPHTDPKLPVWRFNEYFDELLQAMKQRGLKLDHFHIDFGYEGVNYDGRSLRTLDVGRILAVEAYVKSKGVKLGVIFNAGLDRAAQISDRDIANQEAYHRTLRFYRAYISAGGKADHIVLQTWQTYPDRTGPEYQPYTVLNIAKDIITDTGNRRP